MNNKLPKISYVASLKTGETYKTLDKTYTKNKKNDKKIAEFRTDNITNGVKVKQEPAEEITQISEVKTARSSIEDLIRLNSKDIFRISIEDAKKCIREKNCENPGYSIQDKLKQSKIIANSMQNTSIRNNVHKKQSQSSKETKSKTAENNKSSSHTSLLVSSSQPVLPRVPRIPTYTPCSLKTSKEMQDSRKSSSFPEETEQDRLQQNFQPYKKFDKQFQQKPMLQTILQDILMLHEEYESLENNPVDDEINKIRTKHGLPLFKPEATFPVVQTPDDADNGDMKNDDNFVLISDEEEEEKNSTNKINYFDPAKAASQFAKQYENFILQMDSTGEPSFYKKRQPKQDVITVDKDDSTSSSSTNSQNPKMGNIQYKNKDFLITSCQSDTSDSSDVESRLVIDETDADSAYARKRPKIEVCD